ncbi:hypothetical protein GOP47_0028728 [Adiantum capillus-veneris]|nr:hypothetical protein GOP47_0028728 [Adiantum capillus-veneris]
MMEGGDQRDRCEDSNQNKASVDRCRHRHSLHEKKQRFSVVHGLKFRQHTPLFYRKAERIKAHHLKVCNFLSVILSEEQFVLKLQEMHVVGNVDSFDLMRGHV